MAATVAVTSPYPIPTGSILASGPEKISTAKLTVNAMMKTELTNPEMMSCVAGNQASRPERPRSGKVRAGGNRSL